MPLRDVEVPEFGLTERLVRLKEIAVPTGVVSLGKPEVPNPLFVKSKNGGQSVVECQEAARRGRLNGEESRRTMSPQIFRTECG